MYNNKLSKFQAYTIDNQKSYKLGKPYLTPYNHLLVSELKTKVVPPTGSEVERDSDHSKRLENAKETVTPTGIEVERDSDHSKRLGNAKEVVTPTGIEPISSV